MYRFLLLWQDGVAMPIKNSSKGSSSRRLNVTLLILNAFGCITYVVRASPSWAIPQERALGIHSITGEPFVWFAGIFPVIVVFTLLDVLWAAYICIKKRWQSSKFWVLSLALWILAITMDFANH
jgi:hypothetical protein